MAQESDEQLASFFTEAREELTRSVRGMSREEREEFIRSVTGMARETREEMVQRVRATGELDLVQRVQIFLQGLRDEGWVPQDREWMSLNDGGREWLSLNDGGVGRWAWPLQGGRWMVVAGAPGGGGWYCTGVPGRAYVIRNHVQANGKCYWCWKRENEMSMPDGVAGYLCLQCLDRFIIGDGPPWRPNNVQRCEEWLRRMVEPTLPVVECRIPALARFLADPFVP